jgi:hypothetical protein
MRPGEHDLCRGVRTDAGLLEQLRRQRPRQLLDLACELAFFGGRVQHSASDRAHCLQRAARLDGALA